MKTKSLIKLIDIGWIIFFVSIISYIIFDINNIFSTLKEVQKEKVLSTLKIEEGVIAPLLEFRFYDNAKEEIKHFYKSNNLKYIKIKTQNFTYKMGEKNKNISLLVYPIKYKNHIIGAITLGYSNKKLIDSFSKKYFYKFFFYLLILLPIVIFLFIYIRKKIKKLNLLANRLKNINFKRDSKIKLIDDYIEIVNITNAINILLLQVNKFYKHQQKLIKKVMIYKKQLETAQKIAEMFTWQYDCDNNLFESKNFLFIKKIVNMKDINEFIDSMQEKDLFLKEIDNLCKNDENIEMVVRVKSKENKYFYFKIEAKKIFQRKKSLIIGICVNITEEMKKQERIEFLAYHDPLTGLVNRTFLKMQLNTLSEINKRENKKLALIFIDLDNFKIINDTFGHEAGDELLIGIANRLKQLVRESDIVARIGGDEFVIVLNNIKNKDDVKVVITHIQKELIKPIKIDKNDVEITFSAGIALYPDDTTNINEILQLADIAMYESKKEGKNRFYFINKELQANVKKFYNTLDELKNALKKEDELILYFQPKINIKENRVEGVESLIRWEHPKKGILTPYHFIDVAEKGGIINHIDSYVLKKAVQTLKKWQNNVLFKNLSLAVNISANKFLEPNFVKEIKELINEYKIDAKKLQIEITESISIQKFSYTTTILNQIKDLGVKIALDDFGTGYSSLNYLKEIPFDILKIDQTFVRDLLKNKDDVVITKMIVEISKILNKENVAEGVESKEILEIVKNLGVEVIQGYYFSKPLPEKELKMFILNFEKNQ